jgi:hypothetical protein
MQVFDILTQVGNTMQVFNRWTSWDLGSSYSGGVVRSVWAEYLVFVSFEERLLFCFRSGCEELRA